MLSSCAAFLFVGIGITLAGYTRFLDWNEQRAGKVRLNDPILKRLPSPFEASIAVFTVLYSNLALAVYAHVCNGTLCDLLEQQFLVILCRIPAIYMLPLQAPCTDVPLSDPLTTLLRRCRSRLQTHDAAASSCTAARYDKGTGEELSTDLKDDLFFSGQEMTARPVVI